MARAEAAARWADIIARQRGSGLTGAEFICREGLNKASYCRWKRKLGASGRLFTELTLKDDASGASPAESPRLEITLASGDRITLSGVFSPELLERTIKALRRRPC